VVSGCDTPEHLLPDLLFSNRERRSGDIDDKISTRCGKVPDGIGLVPSPVPEIPVIPDVLAYGNPDGMVFQMEDLCTQGRFEIPVLIEYIVGG
jgi:hypothetical protein